MNTFAVNTCFPQGVTLLSNEFLDRYMPAANGEFVKIYLHLLRAVSMPAGGVSLSTIADALSCTEKDVLRALKYWEKVGVLRIARAENETITGITFVNFCNTDVITGGPAPAEEPAKEPETPASPVTGQEAAPEAPAEVPAKETLTAARMEELSQREDISQLLFIASQYLGRTLTYTDTRTLLYFYDGLHFSADLIEYLIEYCVTRGHKSIRYIEGTARGWHNDNVTSVEEAKAHVTAGKYRKEYFDIFRALGIRSHDPIKKEMAIMDKWLNDLVLPMEVIEEACTRTVMTIAKPSLEYADSILTGWAGSGVRTKEDIAKADAARESARAETRRQNTRPQKNPAGNFANFTQRDYDYKDLEARLLMSQEDNN